MFGNAPNSHRVALWLHEQAGGNLSHGLDLARILLSRGIVRYTCGSFVLPHDINEGARGDQSSLLARLDDLSATSAGLCGLLSVHEGAVTLRQLAAATSQSEHAVFLALAEPTSRQGALTSLASRRPRSAEVNSARL